MKIIFEVSIILLVLISSLFAQKIDGGDEGQISLVFSKYSFTHVNEIDARASLDIYVKKYVDEWEKESGKKLLPKIITIEKENTIEKFLSDKIPAMFQLSTFEYLENEKLFSSSPSVIGNIGPDTLQKFILLVRKDSGIKSVKNLKNKTIGCIGGISGLLANLWLETEFLENNGKKKSNHGKIIFVEKPSTAVLNLYFKNYEACVISEFSFEVLCEMNPQLAKELVPISVSEKILVGLSITENVKNPELKKFIRKFALNLTTEEDSRQMLMLFRIHNIIPFKEEYLTGVRRLIKKNKLLKERL